MADIAKQIPRDSLWCVACKCGAKWDVCEYNHATFVHHVQNECPLADEEAKKEVALCSRCKKNLAVPSGTKGICQECLDEEHAFFVFIHEERKRMVGEA